MTSTNALLTPTRPIRHVTVLLLGLLTGCGPSSDTAQGEILSGLTVVTFTTYTDSDCTELPAANSVVNLDTTVECNETPDSSISELVCLDDRITYTNHPNSNDCSAEGIANELVVGVCQEFPGPVLTWKLIEASSYECLSETP
ncbi:MAG: hypothetical protein ACI8RZ_003186 [Myxococcota bacterium]|jgi:hypothetical protein